MSKVKEWQRIIELLVMNRRKRLGGRGKRIAVKGKEGKDGGNIDGKVGEKGAREG